jgi:O-antigen ligase
LFIKKVNKKYLLVFSLFLLSIFVGLTVSKNPLAGFYGIIRFLEFTFLVVFIANNFKYFNRRILFFCFLSGIVLESFLSFLQYFNQGSIGGIFYYLGERTFSAQTPGIANASINGELFLRPYGTFSHPNVLAGFLLIATLYLFLFFSSKNGKIFLLTGIFLGTISLALTLSRGAIFLWGLYLIVIFGTFIVQKYKNKILNPKFFLKFAIAIVAILVLYLNFQSSLLLQRFSLTRISEESLVQRKELIDQSLTMVVRNPVFGVGINNFFNNLTLSGSQLKALQIQPVHNVFLLVLSQTGIIGFSLFLYIFYKILARLISKRSKREYQYLLMIVFSVIFLGFFDHYFLTIQQGQILFSIVLGTVLSYKSA